MDGVCSIGGEELRMDEWDVDGVVTASQKALGTPSGLLVMVVSQRAIRAFESRKAPVANYYASWTNWLPIMKAYEARKPSYFATPAVSLIIAMHTSLKQILTKSMDERFEAHKKASDKFKDAAEKMGLKMVPVNRQVAANTLTALYYPENKTAAVILPKMTQQNIVVAGGLHPDMAAKYFRIGHMGISAVETERGHVEKVIEALKNTI